MIGTRGVHPISLVRLVVVAALVPALLAGVLADRSVARAQEDPGFAIDQAVVVDTDGLNLRADAGLDADVLAVLADGTIGVVADGPVTADGYVWYELDVDGTLGWSAAGYLQPAAGEHGLIPLGSTIIVVTDVLNLRAEPGLEAKIVTTLASGVVATVLDGPQTVDGYVWYQVDAASTTGWAVRDYLAFSPEDDAVLAIGDLATVNTDTLNLRDDATVAGSIVAVLDGGEEVTILDGPVEADGWTWFEVEAAASTGWVAGEYLIG